MSPDALVLMRRVLGGGLAGVLAEPRSSVTDEVSAVQRMGVNIALLRNDEWNFKVTIPRDLELAEHVLASRAGH